MDCTLSLGSQITAPVWMHAEQQSGLDSLFELMGTFGSIVEVNCLLGTATVFSRLTGLEVYLYLLGKERSLR